MGGGGGSRIPGGSGGIITVGMGGTGMVNIPTEGDTGRG